MQTTTTPIAPKAIPTPRPAPPITTGLLFVHQNTETTNWCLITHSLAGRQQLHGALPLDPAATATQNVNQTALVGLEAALKIAPESLLSLYVYNRSVRDCLQSLVTTLPNFTLASTIPNGDLEAARALTVVPEKSTSPAPTPITKANHKRLAPIVVSTDASKRTRCSKVGLGWIINDTSRPEPELGAICASAPDIFAAELLAIEKAAKAVVNRHPSPGQKVRFESDSQCAIDALRAASEGRSLGRLTATQATITRRINILAEGLSFEYVWVKGHASNEMNNVADRLAVAARRNAEMNVPDKARVTIMAQIKEGAMNALAPQPLPAAA